MQQNFVADTSRMTGAAGYVPNKPDGNCRSCKFLNDGPTMATLA